MKYQRTVTFSKESMEKVNFRPVVQSPLSSPSSSGRGRKSQHDLGGCNRQQDVKMELQLNKVRFFDNLFLLGVQFLSYIVDLLYLPNCE